MLRCNISTQISKVEKWKEEKEFHCTTIKHAENGKVMFTWKN
jgi:hypothetical protein